MEVGGDGATGAFKFGVSKNESDAETSFAVDPVDPLERFSEGGLLPIVEDFRHYEADVARNGHKESDLIYKHYVDA
jgi:hypothetical protein